MSNSGPKTTAKTTLPSWLSSGSQQLFKSNLDFLNQPYQQPSWLGADPYGAAATPGYMVAPMNADQTTGFQALRDMFQTGKDTTAATNAQNVTGQGEDYMRQAVATMDPSQAERWMNPFIQQTLAPTIRNIDQERALQNKQLGASAVSANAFGDFRHGVLGGEIARQADTAISDASGKAYSDAWLSALQSQQAAASNYLQAGQGLYSGAAQGYGIYNQDWTRQLGDIQALLQGGQAEQQQSQNLLDARTQLWQQAQQSPYDKLAAAMSLLTGTGAVAPKTTTQQTQTPLLSSLLGGLGSLAGSVFHV